MICKKCGEDISDDEKFCTNCGTQISNPEIDLKNICTKCGIKLDKDLKFCTECGAPVSQVIKEKTASLSEFVRSEDSANSSKLSEEIQSPHQCEQIAGSYKVVTAPDTQIQTEELKPDTHNKSNFRPDSSLDNTGTTSVPDGRLTSNATFGKSHKTTHRMPLIIGGAIILIAVIFYFISSSNNKQTAVQTTSESASSSPITQPANDIKKTPQSQSKPASPSNTAVTPKQTVQGSKPTNVKNTNPANSITAPTAQELLSFAANKEWQRFHEGIKDRATLPKPPFGDRKAARKLNEEALEALNSDAKRAVILLTQAHSIDPGDQEIADNLGLALIVADEYSTAKDHLLKIIEIWPDRATIWFNLAQTLSLQGDNSKEAIGAFVGSYVVSKNKDKTLSYYTKIGNDQDEDAFLRSNVNNAVDIIKSLQY